MIIHAPEQAGPPADLFVRFSNGFSTRIMLPDPPWNGLIDLSAEFPSEVSEGVATLSFIARPDPGVVATATFTVDLTECIEVEVTATIAWLDAGTR